jgi:hypothetical protein
MSDAVSVIGAFVVVIAAFDSISDGNESPTKFEATFQMTFETARTRRRNRSSTVIPGRASWRGPGISMLLRREIPE